MTDAKYTTTLQPISVYGYRIATVTVTEAGSAATTVVFDRPVKVLAKLDKSTVTGAEAATIATTDTAGTKLYFLVQ